MESRIVTRLNITVTNSPIPWTRQTVVNGSWKQDPVMARKGGQPNKIYMEGK